MVSRLRTENEELRRRLTALMDNARHNETCMRRFHEQEMQVLGATGVAELLRQLLFGHRQVFNLDLVTLCLVDREYEIQRLLHDCGCGKVFPEVHFLESGTELATLFGAELMPLLGQYEPAHHGWLFASGPTPTSVAILPLLRQRRFIGSLNLGSSHNDRFLPDSATDFLERLSAVVSIALENALNHERLRRISLTDALTGVHNRRYFDQRLLEEVDRAQRTGQPLSCLFLDVDHFKRINDTWGHQVGDRVLQEVAARAKAQLRLSDALGRYGGEEFAVLLSQTDTEMALEIAERIRQAIAEKTFAADVAQSLAVTLSVGVATLGTAQDGMAGKTAAEWLVAQADQALYRSKQNGRNQVTMAAP